MNPSIKIKSALYCRVSSKEQEETGYSLDAQEKLLKEYAVKNQLAAIKVYRISESASGKQIRKTFDEMMLYVTKNKIPIILCEKIDRLTRNMKDAAIISDWISEDAKREVHFVKESFVVNKNTRAHENLVWDMKVAIARFYTNNLSEEVKKGHKEKLAQGWLPTKPPMGYKTVGEKGRKIHVIDEATAPYIRQMFELYATDNYSLARLESELYKAGLRTEKGKRMHLSRLHRLLSSPFYYGKILWNGELYPSKHEPLISKDLFDKVQQNLKRKTDNPQFTKHNPLFKARIVCEHCGGLVTWELQKGHWYGHCNNHSNSRYCQMKTYIRQEKVEEQLLPIFERIAPKNDWVMNEIERILKEEHASKIVERQQEIGRLSIELDQVRKRKDQIYEDKIDRKIPVEFYERKFGEYSEEETRLESTLVKLNDKADEYQQLGVAIHELAYKSKVIFEKVGIEDRRLLLSQMVTNLVQNGVTISPNYTKAAQFLSNWLPRLNADYELQKTQSLNRKGEVFASSSPVWRRG